MERLGSAPGITVSIDLNDSYYPRSLGGVAIISIYRHKTRSIVTKVTLTNNFLLVIAIYLSTHGVVWCCPLRRLCSCFGKFPHCWNKRCPNKITWPIVFEETQQRAGKNEQSWERTRRHLFVLGTSIEREMPRWNPQTNSLPIRSGRSKKTKR